MFDAKWSSVIARARLDNLAMFVNMQAVISPLLPFMADVDMTEERPRLTTAITNGSNTNANGHAAIFDGCPDGRGWAAAPSVVDPARIQLPPSPVPSHSGQIDLFEETISSDVNLEAAKEPTAPVDAESLVSSQHPPNPCLTTPRQRIPGLFEIFKEEISVSSGIDFADADSKSERIHNFVQIPRHLEHVMNFGYLICLDSFLNLFTVLPVRIVTSVFGIFRRQSLSREAQIDIFRGIFVVVSFSFLQQVDASRLYHTVRGQSVFKLYVIFNVLEICDKLCCAFGQDILDSFFARLRLRKDDCASVRPWFCFEFWLHFVFSVVYILIHAMVLFYQCITLNVAVNSYSNALLTLLVSNQFVEIKSSVFKRFEKENLFQLTCADIVERFQLSIFLMIIATRNFIEMSGTHDSGTSLTAVIPVVLAPMFAVYGCEILVDWLKHAFITKFNNIRPDVYERFIDVLARDLAGSGEGGQGDSSAQLRVMVDRLSHVSRRIGFAPYPLACLVVRACLHTFRSISVDFYWWPATQHEYSIWSILEWNAEAQMSFGGGIGGLLAAGLTAYALLFTIKLVVSRRLYMLCMSRCMSEAMTGETNVDAPLSKHMSQTSWNSLKKELTLVSQNERRAAEAVGERKPTLETIERFTLFKSRIP